MPELDGPGVCRAVRKRSEQTYVYMVLLTSREPKRRPCSAHRIEADDYFD